MSRSHGGRAPGVRPGGRQRELSISCRFLRAGPLDLVFRVAACRIWACRCQPSSSDGRLTGADRGHDGPCAGKAADLGEDRSAGRLVRGVPRLPRRHHRQRRLPQHPGVVPRRRRSPSCRGSSTPTASSSPPSSSSRVDWPTCSDGVEPSRPASRCSPSRRCSARWHPASASSSLFRIVQALGAAVLVPASLALVVEAFPPERRSHAIGLWGASAALASGLGPPIGGALVELGRLAVGLHGQPALRSRCAVGRTPPARGEPRAGTPTHARPRGGGAVRRDARGAHPRHRQGSGLGLDEPGGHRLLRRPRPRSSSPSSSARGGTGRRCSTRRCCASAPSPSATPRRSWPAWASTPTCSPTSCGCSTCGATRCSSRASPSCPGALVAAVLAAVLGPIAQRRGYRLVIVPGAIIWALAYVWYLTRVEVTPDFLGAWLPGQILSGIGVGATLPVLGSAALAAVPGGRFATASAVNSSARQIGAVLGIAILVAIVGTPHPRDRRRQSPHRAGSSPRSASSPRPSIALFIGRVSDTVVEPVDDDSVRPPAVVRRPTRRTARAERRRRSLRLRCWPDCPPTCATGSRRRSEPVDGSGRRAALRARATRRATCTSSRPGSSTSRWRARSCASWAPAPSSASWRCSPGDAARRRSGPVVTATCCACRTRRSRTSSARTPGRCAPSPACSPTQLQDAAPPPSDRPRRRRGSSPSSRCTPARPRPPSPPSLAEHLGRVLRVAQPGRVGPDGLERAERDADRVLLVADDPSDDWWTVCVRQADLLVVVAASDAEPVRRAAARPHRRRPRPRRSAPRLASACARWHAALAPWQITQVDRRPRAAACARSRHASPVGRSASSWRVAARVPSRTSGVLRVAGGRRHRASTGWPARARARSWRRCTRAASTPARRSRCATRSSCAATPTATTPCRRTSLVRGASHREGAAPPARTGIHIEELPRQFRCVSTDLQTPDRRTSIAAATSPAPSWPRSASRASSRRVATASACSSTAASSTTCRCALLTERDEGPIVAVNIGMGGDARPRPVDGSATPPAPNRACGSRRSARPSCARCSSAAAVRSTRARGAGAIVVTPSSMGVGLLEFHQLDRMVESGRQAGRALLEQCGDQLRLNGATAQATTRRR